MVFFQPLWTLPTYDRNFTFRLIDFIYGIANLQRFYNIYSITIASFDYLLKIVLRYLLYKEYNLYNKRALLYNIKSKSGKMGHEEYDFCTYK